MAQELQALPSNYYYQGMPLVILIILIAIVLVALTFYFFGRKKEWSYKKRGLFIGLIIGVIWFIIAGIGILVCNWNPVEGSVVPSGICKNYILISVFYIPSLVTLFPPVTFSLIGILIGWIIGKIKT